MTPREILSLLPKLSALVVGDVCLDRWCTYNPELAEASRETGIPRVAVTKTEVTAGAAGTVANNLAALGVGRVSVLGVVGHDGFGAELSRALGRANIDSSLCIRASDRQTFTYTKLINSQTGIEDLPRVDFVQIEPLDPAIERRLLDSFQIAVDTHDVVLISDQAESGLPGVITLAFRNLLQELAAVYRDRLFFADSRTRIEHFRGVIIKPNQQEGNAACERAIGRVDYEALARHTEAPVVLVTHGGDGVLIVENGQHEWVGARKIARPVDICGAGDSFSAGCAMALRAGASSREAAQFGNLVASVTIMKPGTGTASPEEVLAADEHPRD